MRPMKFRQPIWCKGEFIGWHYWGFIADGNFSGPNTGSSTIAEAQEESQQFTGLKDKNGVEIYEGDIIQWWNKISSPVVVEATDGGWNPFIDDCTTNHPYHYGVIGNIYENKDLLDNNSKE